jgi:hypothetical protein
VMKSGTMKSHQVALFEAGFKAYADGLPRDIVTFPDCDRKWWGWDASQEANALLQTATSK